MLTSTNPLHKLQAYPEPSHPTHSLDFKIIGQESHQSLRERCLVTGALARLIFPCFLRVTLLKGYLMLTATLFSLSPDINGEPRSASDLLLSDLLVQSQQSLLLTAPLPDHGSTNTNPFAIIPDASSVFSVGAGGATFSSEDTRRLEQALRVDPNPRPVGYNSKYSYGEPLIGR